jgi:hypothetical protein
VSVSLSEKFSTILQWISPVFSHPDRIWQIVMKIIVSEKIYLWSGVRPTPSLKRVLPQCLTSPGAMGTTGCHWNSHSVLRILAFPMRSDRLQYNILTNSLLFKSRLTKHLSIYFLKHLSIKFFWWWFVVEDDLWPTHSLALTVRGTTRNQLPDQTRIWKTCKP